MWKNVKSFKSNLDLILFYPLLSLLFDFDTNMSIIQKHGYYLQQQGNIKYMNRRSLIKKYNCSTGSITHQQDCIEY